MVKGLRRHVRPVWIASPILAGLLSVGVGVAFQSGIGAGGPPPSQALIVPATPLSSLRAHVRLEVLATARDGATGTPRVETSATMGPGEQTTRYLVVGDREPPDICQASFPKALPTSLPYYGWQLDVRVVAVSAGSTTMEVGWSRSHAGTAGSERESEGIRTIRLAPGEFHLLDYVAAPPNSSSVCASLMLQILADPVPQADPQPLLTYDIWLEHDGQFGRRWSHQQVEARSTSLAWFALKPLAWSLEGKAASETDLASAVRLAVSGTIRGTLGPDGYVDVAVAAFRNLSWHDRGRGDQGRQDYRGRLGESVAILLPDPSGDAEVPMDYAGPPTPGLTMRGKTVVLDFRTFFSDSRASLYIVARRKG